MKIRNIITTSALVVLLGLTGGSLYADDLGDNDSHTPGSAVSELVYTASSDANEVASTGFNGVSVQVGDLGDNDILVLRFNADSGVNEVEIATTDSFELNEIPYSDK